MRDSTTTAASTHSSSRSSQQEQQQDFNHGTWMSLLGLLNPWEFIVTVDKTTLWRRHVAWAKPQGKDIRDYTTQQFASNIVFLSLLLGSEMGVFLNSSTLLTHIRESLANANYGSLQYYIGCILIIDICVTLLGLVATFTAWSMIAALSDSNSHAILRSSMGQYVTILPMRLVVASLYLFLLWIVLIIINLMKGPVPYLIVATVGFMFFQMVSSLSCFGRLIIHTGAMGQKRVLDPEFERHLLPSGLHASLLIKATERARRCTSATAQYQKNTNRGSATAKTSSSSSTTTNGRLPNTSNSSSSASSEKDNQYMPPQPSTNGLRRYPSAGGILFGGGDGDGALANDGRSAHYSRNCNHEIDGKNNDDDGNRMSEADHSALLHSARAFRSEHMELEVAAATPSSPLSSQHQTRHPMLSYGATSSSTMTTTESDKNVASSRHSQHQRDVSTDSTVESLDDLLCHEVFPHPSVLNRVSPTQLRHVVKQTLEKTNQLEQQQHHLTTLTEKKHDQQQQDDTSSRPDMRKLAKERQESSVRQLVARRRAKSTAVAELCQEWTDEEQVRDLYGYDPPVQIDLNLNDSDDDNDDEPSDFKMMPRPSLLNRSTRLQSLRNLLTFRGGKADDHDNDEVDTGEEDHNQTPQHECTDGHVRLSCIYERVDETESSTHSNFSSSISSGMDAVGDDDSNDNIHFTTSSSPRSRRKRHNSLPLSGNSSVSGLSTLSKEHLVLSTGSTSSSSNTTPLLRKHHDEGQYQNSTFLNNSTSSMLLSDEDEESGACIAAQAVANAIHDDVNATEVERQHLLSARPR